MGNMPEEVKMSGEAVNSALSDFAQFGTNSSVMKTFKICGVL